LFTITKPNILSFRGNVGNRSSLKKRGGGGDYIEKREFLGQKQEKIMKILKF